MSSDDYKIGYKKPPKYRQFKLGQSGNPKGRPKKSDDNSIWETFESVLNQEIPVKKGEYTTMMSAKEAIVHTLLNSALKGQHQALKTIFQYAEKIFPPGHSIAQPIMIIKPPDGPMSPAPPIYGEEDESNE